MATTSDNYFDCFKPKFEENGSFYENLKHYINSNPQWTIDECADTLYEKIFDTVDISSDFDELFVQVWDKEISNDNNCKCTKIMLLLCEKLNIEMEESTINDFFAAINNDADGPDISPYTRDNQELMIQFILERNLYSEFYGPAMTLCQKIMNMHNLTV